MSKQSEVAALTLGEIQRDRERSAMPFPVVIMSAGETVTGRLVQKVSLKNIGRGPALNCVYVRQEKTPEGLRFLVTERVHIGPGDSATISALEQTAPKGGEDLFTQPKPPRDAIFCQDEFGNMFQFTPRRPEPQIWRAEGIEELEEDKPDWAVALTQILGP